MTIWLHRISHCADTAHPLLDRGYLTIGFSDFSRTEFSLENPEFISKVSDQDKSYFDSIYSDLWGGAYWNGRNCLWRFLAEMEAGDRVVVPGFHDQGSFSIFEIVDGSPLPIGSIEVAELRTWVGKTVTLKDGLLYRENEEDPVDLGFAIKVRPVVMDLSRSLFADARLTSRMKTLWTNSNISDLQESIDRAIDGYRSDHPINLHTTLLERHTQVTLDAICSELNPAKFEQLIAWYFWKVGATQVEIPPKNERDKEGDADIVATFEPIKTIIYVQAKKHAGETNDWAVEQIKNYRDKQDTVLKETDTMDDGYSRIAWVVSTADRFSKECSSLAKQNRVLLLNGREFVRLLLNAGLEGLEKAF